MREITLPLPPSTNHLYDYGRRGVYLSREYEKFQWAAWQSMKDQSAQPFGIPPAALRATYEVFLPSARCDVTNYIKAAEDMLSKFLGFNDNRVVEVHAYKFIDRKQPRLVVRLEDISGEPRREPGIGPSRSRPARAPKRK